ncbi:hypothetical protein [Streptomyces sp. NPDC098781]|uniref:hypothetical protein n=1 Tax=Streptomyces sp. NPDC098781 TaxID=3366097 RepID=UPI003824C940
MKLGKALATGMAEERPRERDETLELAEGMGEIGGLGEIGEITEAGYGAAVAPEEVPSAR